MTTQFPFTDQIISLVSDVITPIMQVDRTMVMPFDHQRHENTGEHSLALGLLAGALAEKIDPSLDTGKVTEYALVHDVVEIHAKDVTVWATEEAIREKQHNEALSADRILHDFPTFPWIIRKYKEFEELDTPEKRFVYVLDRMYPHILIIAGDHHPVHPSWEAYKHTEDIAKEKIALFPALLPLFEDLCKIFRQKPHFFSTPIPLDEKQ